jgi:glycosyltransferase involved in cell wall biosynthesis
MAHVPIFLSILIVVRNQADRIVGIAQRITDSIAPLVSDYEVVIIDNASNDGSLSTLKNLTGETGLPNLQVYALTKEVDVDTASCVGLENALGDFVVILDPFGDDMTFLPEMLEAAVGGADVVFATNRQNAIDGFAYRAAYVVFNRFYRWLSGIDLTSQAPHYRILSKKVVNFILRHPQPAITYRYLPATGGFTRVNLSYDARPRFSQAKRLSESFDRGMRFLVSTTQAPMRIVTTLSLFGAVANLLYAVYVFLVAVLKSDVEPGWISLSLQQSGMFFLISLVLLVLGEYILNMARLSSEGPTYHIAQEFTSARISRRERLNVEQVVAKS